MVIKVFYDFTCVLQTFTYNIFLLMIFYFFSLGNVPVASDLSRPPTGWDVGQLSELSTGVLVTTLSIIIFRLRRLSNCLPIRISMFRCVTTGLFFCAIPVKNLMIVQNNSHLLSKQKSKTKFQRFW